ncbi:hypothetical protein GF337_10075 [candidate division KSB1 bacterium]|nr:hypothetical protein [candidate division KSB1 bacterium]
MNHKKHILTIFILFIAICTTGNMEQVFADETKWMAVGMLHDWYSSAGCEIEVGRTREIPDQLDGLQWPAQFRNQDSKAAKALWIGATNYFDPLKNKTYPHKVVHVGPRVLDEENEFMPVEFKMYGRFERSRVIVDGVEAGKLDYLDAVDVVDPTLVSDRMLYNVVNTSIGITEYRKIYAFSQQNHNNYFIYDYTFKNTGIIDLEGTTHSQTLENVIFYFQYRYSPCKEGTVYGDGWLPQSLTWGHSTMNDARNEMPSSVDPLTWPENAPPRVLFSWQGLHSKAAFSTIGGPYGTEGGDGHLGAAQYVGVMTLHASKSGKDASDDPFQPTTTQYIQSDEKILSDNDQFNEPKMTEEYAAMSAGHPPIRMAEDVGCPTPINCNGYGDTYIYAGTKGSNPGGYTHTQGFGPYTIEPGDSIRLVVAEAVNGINRDLCYEVGANWLSGENMVLPDGSTTTDAELYKNSWVYTGEDSIFQTFYRAIDVFEEYENTGNFNIPQAPPPPDQFEINSGGDRITLSWSDNADTWSSDLWTSDVGYRVYRAMHVPDTTFDLIFECGTGTDNPTVVHEFEDKTAQRGFDYYYYVTSVDFGSIGYGDRIKPGVLLESSKFYTMTLEPAYLKRPPGKTMDDIRIVPNPYNIRAREIQFGYSAPDRVMFYDIPPICTIKIYTERGDLIKTIEHTNSTGDEEWNLNTKYRQVVVSGIYIVVFETPDGKKAIRKLIVIR